jgi:hypothetical protein
MDKSFNIFDIDSALDLLEDSLEQNLHENREEKLISTTISTQSLQQQLDNNDNKENRNLSVDAIDEPNCGEYLALSKSKRNYENFLRLSSKRNCTND